MVRPTRANGTSIAGVSRLILLAGVGCHAVHDGDAIADSDVADHTDETGQHDTGDPGEGCFVEVADEGTVPVLDECEPAYDEVLAPWAMTDEWSYCPIDGRVSVTMPVVGHSGDDDGDGLVGPGDTPDVALPMSYEAGVTPEGLALTLLDGVHGSVTWRRGPASQDVTGVHYGCSVALGDVDGDGDSEVVGVYDVSGSAVGSAIYGGRLLAIDGEGAIVWESPSEGILSGDVSTWGEEWGTMCALTVADLQGDGAPEVVTDWGIYDGRSGVRTVDLFASGREGRITHPVVADLDRDGVHEILLGEVVYDHEGTALWSAEVGEVVGGALHHGTVMVPAELDGDDAAEIVALHDDTLSAYDTDGTPLYDAALTTAGPILSLPCLGDFDGDGSPELGYTAADFMGVVELDGTPVWSVSAADAYADRVDGCSAADLDGDGDAEFVDLTEDRVEIRDGHDGHVLTSAFAPGRLGHQVPAIVDVDADGAAEIVVSVDERLVGSGGEEACVGLRVFGHAGSGWSPADTVWGTIDQADGKQRADGSIALDPWWRQSFRGRRVAEPGPGRPELAIAVVDECVDTCDGGTARVSWQVSNRGGASAPAARVELWTGDVLVASADVGLVPAGSAMAGGVFDVDVEVWGGAELVLRVTSDSASCTGWDPVATFHVPCG
jgi:hypothetical protein